MLKLHNTLTGQKEEFKSIKSNHVSMYVCGPTVYDADHIGHARTYIGFDLLHRLLRYLNYQVNYVQNVTDVGHLVNDAEVGADKVQKRAAETGQSPRQLADHYTEMHLEDMAALNVLAPSHQPKASDHIREIQDFITSLINAGFAYFTTQGNVYFAVSKKADYGKLSHRSLTEIITGTRVEAAGDKRSAADFALWKSSRINDPEMTWDSPWGRGYPGWHIECSAMSRKYLGDTFDIHGSAVEHVFPHHENEIAQSEALTNKPMANFWVHTGMLTINGRKMSKSLHNQVTVKEALKEYSANELRLAFMLSHYRRPFDYTKDVMEQGIALRRKIFQAYPELEDSAEEEILSEIISALLEDMDTPRALSILEEKHQQLGKQQTDKLFEVLGLVRRNIEDDEKALTLSREREQARSNGDYLTADNRKAELRQLGFEVIDSSEATTYISR